MKNPILEKSNLKHGAIPFDKISNEHFLPAVESAITMAKEKIVLIKNNPEPATFENTLVKLELCTEELDRAHAVFHNLFSAHTNEELQKLSQKIDPIVAAFSNDLYLDEQLFARIQSIYEQREELNLNTEEKTLLKKYYKNFVRNGALLNSKQKEELRAIDKELSALHPKFGENVLKATNAFILFVESEQELDGLPQSAKEAAKELAQNKNKPDQWAFNLQFPSYYPVIKHARNRELREKLTRASGQRAFGGEYDNQEIIKKIVQLRHKRANLLGYKTHAEFVLQERMAESPETVLQFLKRLIEKSKEAAFQDLDKVSAAAKKRDNIDKVMPWDFTFYQERVKESEFNFDEEILKPYFKLENVVDGVFKHAEKLFGLEFNLINEDVPVYHPDVNAYEVFQRETGTFMGLFYTDFYPRESKRSGAWATTYKSQGLIGGKIERPHVSIVCNFTKPTEKTPSLLSLMEVKTLFHEFGHGLHMLLSDCVFPSLSGASVYWDFVELPSQILENWVSEKEGLSLYAKHYQTGEIIPDELIEKIKNVRTFMAGSFSLRQLNFGILDMTWHTVDPSEISDVDQFERQATQETSLLPKIEGTNFSCGFSHIFAGGYAAGYYSYKWAEVLEADAFELFKERGVFDQQTAQSFLKNILSRGGSEHPMELYKRFRGREPDPDALLRKDGLI